MTVLYWFSIFLMNASAVVMGWYFAVLLRRWVRVWRSRKETFPVKRSAVMATQDRLAGRDRQRPPPFQTQTPLLLIVALILAGCDAPVDGLPMGVDLKCIHGVEYIVYNGYMSGPALNPDGTLRACT
jgi:hypothetical protein